jgi:putative dehydrogenase
VQLEELTCRTPLKAILMNARPPLASCFRRFGELIERRVYFIESLGELGASSAGYRCRPAVSSALDVSACWGSIDDRIVTPWKCLRAGGEGELEPLTPTLTRVELSRRTICPRPSANGPLAASTSQPGSANCRAKLYLPIATRSMETLQRIAAVIAPTGAAFVDGGIIGDPPGSAGGPTIYASGGAASALAILNDLGLHIRQMDAPIGAASALKMSYAGINKGITLLVSAMVLGAIHEDAAGAPRAEMSESQGPLLRRMTKSIRDMYPKTYRCAPEMEESAQFLREDPAACRIYEDMAELCGTFSNDHANNNGELAKLAAFLAPLIEFT